MRISTLIPILAGAASVSSFHVPANATDGIYSVFTHDNGTEVHERIGDLPAPSAMENFSLTGSSEVSSRIKRQNTDWTSTACYPQEGTEDLDHPTCDAANAALDAQCGGGSVVRAGLDYYSISGCVVAYFCNFGWGDRACYASDRQRGSARITQVCGWYKPGSVRYNDITPVTSYSYGYESYCTAKGHNFCGRGA